MVKIWKNLPEKFRFLLVGGWNTFFGFCLGLVLYYSLIDRVNIILIGILGNIISITMSFLTNKLLVFRTKGNWLEEYLRCYLIYGFMAITSIALLWLFVEFYKFNIVVSQLLILTISVFLAYVGHSRFTYKK